MKFFSILTLFIVLALSSCTFRAPKPKPLLSERQMVELLTEMHLIEASLQQTQIRDDNFGQTRLYTTALYNALFERFGLTQESFEANLFYRTHRSRDIEQIYTKVADNLQLLVEQNQENEPIF